MKKNVPEAESIEEAMSDLYVYLNTQLEVLNELLAPEICESMIYECWTRVLGDLLGLMLGTWENDLDKDSKEAKVWENRRIEVMKISIEVFSHPSFILC